MSTPYVVLVVALEAGDVALDLGGRQLAEAPLEELLAGLGVARRQDAGGGHLAHHLEEAAPGVPGLVGRLVGDHRQPAARDVVLGVDRHGLLLAASLISLGPLRPRLGRSGLNRGECWLWQLTHSRYCFLPFQHPRAPAVDAVAPVPQLLAVTLAAQQVGLLEADQAAAREPQLVAVGRVVAVVAPLLARAVDELDVGVHRGQRARGRVVVVGLVVAARAREDVLRRERRLGHRVLVGAAISSLRTAAALERRRDRSWTSSARPSRHRRLGDWPPARPWPRPPVASRRPRARTPRSRSSTPRRAPGRDGLRDAPGSVRSRSTSEGVAADAQGRGGLVILAVLVTGDARRAVPVGLLAVRAMAGGALLVTRAPGESSGRSSWQVVHGGGDACPSGPCGRWQFMQPPWTVRVHAGGAILVAGSRTASSRSVLCWSWQFVHCWCAAGAVVASAGVAAPARPLLRAGVWLVTVRAVLWSLRAMPASVAWQVPHGARCFVVCGSWQPMHVSWPLRTSPAFSAWHVAHAIARPRGLVRDRVAVTAEAVGVLDVGPDRLRVREWLIAVAAEAQGHAGGSEIEGVRLVAIAALRARRGGALVEGPIGRRDPVTARARDRERRARCRRAACGSRCTRLARPGPSGASG